MPESNGIPELLREKARRWEEVWGLPGLLDSVTVEFSTRMRVSLGLCRPAQGRIRLAVSLLNGGADPGTGGLPASDVRSSLLEEVLCHELAHVAVHRLYGPRAKPHGPEWKSLLVKAGLSGKLVITKLPPPDEGAGR